MKHFIIVGLHGSGKHEIMNILETLGVTHAKLFSNLDKPSGQIYNSYDYEQCDTKDIDEIFENEAYIFLRELKTNHKVFSEGLSIKEFDENPIVSLSPDQIISISPNMLPKDVCYVWIDNNKTNRHNRYHNERRSYKFNEREELETSDISAFIKTIYEPGNQVLYFMNEEPSRIATIIYTLIKHPELLSLYQDTFGC